MTVTHFKTNKSLCLLYEYVDIALKGASGGLLYDLTPPSLPQIASITNLFLVIEVYIPIKIRSVDLSGISVIEMSVRPTLGIMSIVHNINGARLLTPLGVSTIETMVTKVTMVIE